MKTILRVFGKLNRRALVGLALCAAIAIGCFQIAARAETVTAGYNGQAAWNNAYAGGGTGLGYGYVVDNIERIYGADAKAAYQNAVITGDYTAFRTLIGDWRCTYQLKGVNVHPDGRVFEEPINTAQELEYAAYSDFGKYGTVNDLYAYAAQYGYDLNDPNQYNQYTIAIAVTKTIPKPAKKSAPAKTTTAPAANNTKVEALKTYKGNDANFNAYWYYTNYADLQAAYGADGKALKNHWNQYGQKEGRIANKAK